MSLPQTPLTHPAESVLLIYSVILLFPALFYARKMGGGAWAFLAILLSLAVGNALTVLEAFYFTNLLNFLEHLFQFLIPSLSLLVFTVAFNRDFSKKQDSIERMAKDGGNS